MGGVYRISLGMKLIHVCKIPPRRLIGKFVEKMSYDSAVDIAANEIATRYVTSADVQEVCYFLGLIWYLHTQMDPVDYIGGHKEQ